MKSTIQKVTGATAPVKVMGIVPITLKGSYKIHLLYPCYHMPHNPQDTLGLTAFKYYNDMKMVRLEALSWLKFETNDGDTFRTHTLTKYHKAQLLDYVTVQIHHPKTEPTMLTSTINFSNTNRKQKIDKPSSLTTTMMNKVNSRQSPIPMVKNQYTHATKVLVLSTLFSPIINNSFSKNDYVDWSIIHRRFDHISDDKLGKMCTEQLLEGLSSKFPQKDRIHRRDCWMCPKGSLQNVIHCITINTDHLKPGQ